MLGATRLGGLTQVENQTFSRLRAELELEPFFRVLGAEILLEFDRLAVFHGAPEVFLDRGAEQHRVKIP